MESDELNLQEMLVNKNKTNNDDSFIRDIQDNLPSSSIYVFFLSIFLAQAWVIYITLYNSRVFGLVITWILNKFVKYGHISFGSFSFSVLSGKIMIRDFHYITEDFSVRIQYGWIIFKWWQKYIPKDLTEDLSHMETRVQMFLDGFQIHVYNKVGTYDRLDKLFGSSANLTDPVEANSNTKSSATNVSNINWRDLIPVIKVEMSSGRIIFGNHLVPHSLIFSFEDGHFTYTTKPASTPFDQFMHDATGKAENFKLMFVQSNKYTGPLDEAPRYMGEGFIVLQTRKIDIHFYMDEPGIVPYEPESVELADGETVVRRTYPCLGMDVKCGKNTDINYGPWVDKQRELLWKFFYPADYQDMVPTEEAKPGEYRNYKKFEFMMNLMQTSTIDILFTKDSETQAIHMSTSQGSYVEVTVPWITSPDGFTSTVHGQLLLVDATTSLQYRSLVECETFEFTVKASYPPSWNSHQDWTCDFIACKTAFCLIFDHKHFFSDLINDWSVKTVPDLYHFVPYTWTINFQIKEFELILVTNEYNWIDTSSHQPENAQIAFCGDLLDMSLVLPYTDFLPDTVHVGLVFKGENAFCRLYLPVNNTSRHVLEALSKNVKLMDRNGKIMEEPFGSEKKQWRRMTQRSDGWVDCWTTSNVAISIGYNYHPMPVLLQQAPSDEESLTAPLRPSKYLHLQPPDNFDPGEMDSDLIAVELEVAPSMLCVYGSLLRNFLHVKENYLGEDQKFTDFEDANQTPRKSGQGNLGPLSEEKYSQPKPFDERYYRPFAVTVSVAIHEIHGHLVKNCNMDDLPCPSIMLDRLCFEMDKAYKETKLQLLLSPVILIAKDTVSRENGSKQLNEGHLGLSGLQVRGHAMFSHEGLPLDSETLEYGWLVEAIIGDFTGKLTSAQLQNLVEFIQTFIMLVEDPENSMERPQPHKLCQHMLPQPQCRMLTQYNFPCPTSEEIKYEMVRLSLDSVNFCLVESGTALNVQVSTVKMSTCNLHGTNTRAGITGRVENISLRQFIASSVLKYQNTHPEIWLESGSLIFGPLDAEAAMALPNPDFHVLQDRFLRIHDKKTKRLWFLWSVNELKTQPTVVGKCGCHGGCAFFGRNRNGVGFFSHRKTKEATSKAVLQVSPQGQDPGFGQSLLVTDKLVFDVLPNNGELSPAKNFSFTRGYMSDVLTPESPGTNITVIEDRSLSHNSSTLTVSKAEQDASLTENKDHVDSSSVRADFSDKTVSPGSESLPQDSLTSPVSETRSLVSRLSSMEEGLAKQMPSISSSPLLEGRRKVSMDLGDVHLARTSKSNVSLPSSSKSLRQEKTFSVVSLESERYYSAEEDNLENTTAVSGGSIDDSMLSTGSQDQTLRLAETDMFNETVVPGTVRRPVTERQDSESTTGSSSSFESAATDQSDSSDDLDEMDSPEFMENISMVDLHGQVNKPITQSPILMSCYSGHLTQYECKDWSSPQPIQGSGEMKHDQSAYSLSSACHSLQYIHSPACLPHFKRLRQGFSPGLMTAKEKLVSNVHDQGTAVDGKNSQGDTVEETLLENASITTGVVKLHGSMDITLTPLFLESFQRYTEAVTPTLMLLHPSSIVDGLHSQCLERLKRQNRLKKGKTSGEEDTEKQVPERQFSTDSRNQEGEMKTSSIQALLTVSKINICVLQAGIVEEVISFSALDNLHDLTCVSLLALCIDNVECQLLSNSHSCKTFTDVSQVNNPQMSPKKRAGRTNTEVSFAERQTDKQLIEVCREEDVGTLNIARIHLQLQRLLKNSNYLDDDIHLTAIPEHRSKVLFKFDEFPFSGLMKMRRHSSARRESMLQSPKTRVGRNASFSRQSSRDSDGRGGTLPKLFKQGSIEEEKKTPKLKRQESRESYRGHDRGIGYIMFECGLEDIKATAVRRLGFKDIADADFLKKMDNISRKLEDIQNSTKQDIEWHLGEKKEPVSPTKKAPPKRQDATEEASLHSWDSRVSIPSSCSSIGDPHIAEDLEGDASSGILELKTIWLNFAAPPPISIKRKVDFTRLDWNLLSTATTAINAWLNPADRLMCEIRCMMLTLTRRTSAVIACIMTNALEVEGIKLPNKSKYSKVTTLAQILQEEPSCQLLTALRRYLNKVGTKPVEDAVKSDTMPQLITIQKGILALTRQWKNLLYMPQTKMSFKDRKSMRPYTVKFAAPENGEDHEISFDMDSNTELLDTVDERASLLLSEERSVHQSASIPSLAEHVEVPEGESRNSSFKKKYFGKLHQTGSGTPPTTSLFDSPVKTNLFSKISANLQTPNFARNDSTYSFHSAAASLNSMEDTPPPTPMKPELPKSSILKNKEDKISDLYQWMSMQKDDFKQPFDDNPTIKRHDSLINAFGSAWSQEDSKLDLTDEQFATLTSIMQLADAQSLFRPFLQSVGLHVEGVRPSAMMKKFGGALSLEGKLKFLKIEISDSGRRKGKGKSRKHRTKLLNLTDEMPAFLCQDFCVSVGMKDVVDFETKESGEAFDPNCQLNFAMHKLEAKPTTLQVNFSINCNSVTQHVDMPLLRLIHQFVTMAENVEETRNELKQNHTADDWTKTHRKQESKGSNSSGDTDTSDGPSPTEMVQSTWKPEARLPVSVKSDILESDSSQELGKTAPGGVEGRDGRGNQSSCVLTPPQSLNLSKTVAIDIEETSSPAVTEKTFIDELNATTPKCWKTLCHLLELYSTMPEPKTVKRKPSSKLPVIEEEPEAEVQEEGEEQLETPSDTSKTGNHAKLEELDEEEKNIGMPRKPRPSISQSRFKQSIYVGETIPLVVFGIAKVQEVKILAVLSGLKLEASLRNVHASGTYREKVKGFVQRKSSESSVTAHIGNTLVQLFEGIPPEMNQYIRLSKLTVVTITIDKTQALHTTILRRGKEHNSAMISVGLIEVDIPQHPVVLHGMMTRGSKQISSTLQEFRRPVSRSSRNLDTVQEVSSAETFTGEAVKKPKTPAKEGEKINRPKFLHIHVKAIFQGLITGASLLPSLKAQHKTGSITLSGMTGKKSRFTMDLQKHQLSFKSKVQTTETSLPSEAEIELPPIHMYADYRPHKQGETPSDKLGEGLVLKEGDFLHAVAEIGMLEHSLTTDLLNHLVFVQKVFMKEVNELVQKVSGSDQPVPLWEEGEVEKHTTQDLLYSFSFRFKGVQITATTPTSSAVRLETGSVELEVSNRVLMATAEAKDKPPKVNEKMFIKAQVKLNVALGQLIKNPMFEEAEPEFQTMAFFKTKIGIRNALQDELIPGAAQDQEALLITLTRPIILAQPQAFDKAVLVWLNYKNAYEYWTEQRMALNTEVLNATRQVIDRIPAVRSPTSLSTLFLQLTVDDMGICVPVTSVSQLYPTTPQTVFVDNEPGSALVLTIKSTQISACSSGSLVSKGRFQDFCLRFADDFETSWDDWKPDPKESPVMNACVVPEGTYEVCSRTINKQASDPLSNAKWILNVRWEMQGIAVHLNTNVGKCFSSLGKTLTTLAGEPDEELSEDEMDARSDHVFSMDSPSESMTSIRRPSQMMDTLPPYVYDTTMDPKLRFRLIEKEMNEQARVVQDLKQLGASLQTIEVESRKLEELKAIVFQDFRREMLNKLKKQSESRASALKDQLGLGNRPAHVRSKSYGGTRERKSAFDYERIAGQNRGIFNRNSAWDGTRTLPSKVQFGASIAYSPPETPDSKSSHPYSQYSPQLEDHSLLFSDSSFTSDTSSESSSEPEDKGTLKRVSVIKEDIQASTESLDFSSKYNTLTPSLGSGGSSSRSTTAPEPNIDFELDVKVFIDSGKCVLHPKDTKEEDATKKQQKREKTPDPLLSPSSKKKGKKIEMTSTPMSVPGKKPQAPQQIEDTVFFLPSIDLKVHYNSKTHSSDQEMKSKSSADSFEGEEPGRRKSPTPEPSPGSSPLAEESSNYKTSWPPPDFPKVIVKIDEEQEEVMMRRKFSPPPPRVPPRPQPPFSLESIESRESTSSAPSKKSGVKKANLYAWLSLQSLPEEMVISPCLLDFLEQALEPIPIGLTMLQQSKKEEGSTEHLEAMDSSYSTLGNMVYQTSFPVDVVVFIRVEPSIIRFNCLPTSRVECLLKLPALETVFSTKSTDIESGLAEGTPPLKAKVSKLRERHPSGSRVYGEARPRASSTTSSSDSGSLSVGGLSFTGAMSDFSLYIFHPYGGGNQRKPNIGASPGYNLGSIQENEPAWSEQTRRDMLSLNVEFVKINISRSRKIELRSSDKEAKSNIVRFSAICDIGSAAFKYDMRRLSEILSFPKAWYNRSLARRMFLGDESYTQVPDEEYDTTSTDSSQGDSPVRPPVSKLFTSSPSLSQSNSLSVVIPGHHRRSSSGDKIKVQLSMDLKQQIDSKLPRTASMPQSPTDGLPSESFSHTHTGTPGSTAKTPGKQRSSVSHSEGSKHKGHHSSSHLTPKSVSWETLVLFAVNLAKLDLHVNMSNVMGNTVWTTEQIKSQGSLSIHSNGHRDLKITAGTGNSHFDSRGGVVGGTIDLNDLNLFVEVDEDPEQGKQPLHSMGVSLHTIECRMDYMGSSVLMARLNELRISMKDEWHVQNKPSSDTPLATNRPAILFAHGDLNWEQFHMMISRSTTPDIIKMVSKIEEFFMNQFNSSRRVLSAFGPLPVTKRGSDRRKMSDDLDCIWDIRHHRHWQRALELVVGCRFSMLPSMIPKQGTILGGNMSLKGKNLTLACFHGMNFKAKSWALFIMHEPYIIFATESQQLPEGGIHVIQNLNFYVGHDLTQHTQDQHNAYICMLSRGHSMPPSFTSVQEWFHYTLAASDVKGLDCFPQTAYEDDALEARRIRKVQAYSHDTEIIFLLPSLQLQLKTIHNQSQHEPKADEPRPVVECSFVTEFEDHIFVAMDAEVILFLHDLILSYIKEKDKGTKPPYGTSAKSPRTPESERKRITDPTTALKEDWRVFECNTWHLEPTVRLLHWASKGKEIDTVVVDYVLQKLGFSHARVTIPKWMQRGFMDPLDKLLSFLIEKLILALKSPEEEVVDGV
ncbi:bridge-like lipid transfer protein family member 1 isoform X3 [Magallana gigas]|uniref:bridge-like lipid transfer protein family member 1 isoform X3 n=1 Tax=Magallana gigas TaxID=29159 RepID=UPI003341D537